MTGGVQSPTVCVRFYSEAERRKRWLNRQGVLNFDVEPPPAANGFFPGSECLVLRLGGDARPEAALARWGIQPAWATDPTFGKSRAYNARGETVHEKPTFREPFKLRRCAIPITDFFERFAGRWEVYTPVDHEALAIAGIWEVPNALTQGLPTFSFVTCEPNEVIAKTQERMPVLLKDFDVGRWLDRETSMSELRTLMTPAPPEWLEISDGGPISPPKKPVDTSTASLYD